MSLEQAQACSNALDLYARICMGQIEEVAQMVAMGRIKPNCDTGAIASPGQCDQIRGLTASIKAVLGLSSGQHHGIGSKLAGDSAHRAWEVMKVMDKAMAMHRNPSPDFRGVNYDGLLVRYTQDKEPICSITIEGE